MPLNYYGDNRVNIVNQNNSFNHDYDNIYTYGAGDQITLTLNRTFVDAGDGNDTVKSRVENNNDIKLGSGNDTYIGNGFSNNNNYDIVHGNNGNDTMTVATAISDYYGDNGNDTFNSAGYWNYFNGGSGNDTISYQRQDTDNYLQGRGVKVDLYGEYATTGGGREEELRSIENAIGTSYADTIYGSNGNNKLWGMNGFDVLKGADGNDTIYGGNGGDNLYGNSGNDKLIGGLGNDRLEGDSGADTFIFQTVKDSVVGANRDVIVDFTRSQGDKVDVSGIDPDFDFIGNHAFSGTAGELQFKNHILSGDVDGDGKADFQVAINNMTTMHSSDFIL